MKNDNNAIEKTVVFTASGKSGAKTTNIVHLGAFLASRQIPFQFIESDTVTMGLTNFHVVPIYDITTRDGMKTLLDDVRRSQQKLYAIDTPAAKTRELMSLVCPLADLKREYQKQTGIRFTALVPMTSNEDSIYQAQIICDSLARTSASIILTLNNFPLDVSEIYARSKIKEILAPKMESGEAVVVSIPACTNVAALARLWELGLDAHAVQGESCDVMQPFDQADLHAWYTDVCSQYQRTLPLILPQGQVPTNVEAQPAAEQLLDIAALKKQRRQERAEVAGS